jgi:hypothetical protein
VRRALELRPWPDIAVGYALAPFAGLAAMWLIWLVEMPSAMLDGNWTDEIEFFLGAAGVWLIVEFALLTPLLAGFRLYRWRWLNGWTGALLGALIGTAFALLVEPWVAEIGAVESLETETVLEFLVLPFGVAGAIWAFVLRLIAVRLAPPRQGVEVVFD